ncbi:MAG: hypothetical protein AB8B91_09525 [Rubripirellula sp.]
MTTKESTSREMLTIAKIESVLRVHEQLRQYATALQISIENAAIVLRGELPSLALRAELIPAVRRAGVLGQVNVCVDVPH